MSDKPEKKPDAAAAAPAKGDAGAAKDAGKDAHGAPRPRAAGASVGCSAKTPVMLGGVMILEAMVLFAGFKFLGGGPKPVGASVITEEAAAGGEHGEPAKDEHGNPIPGAAKVAKGKTAEVQVLDFKAQNRQTGRMLLYDLSVFVVVKSESETQLRTRLARKALITDRIRTIIAQNDPEKLGGGSEPGLETLRRQVKHQLDEIVGDGLIRRGADPEVHSVPHGFLRL